MFVQAELSIALTFEVAKRALDRALADGGLIAESHRAVEDGLVFVMPVGARGRPRAIHGGHGQPLAGSLCW